MTQPVGYILTQDLAKIPVKRYFTIGEVSELCGVRSYVLRYWEQEFPQLSPMKRRGNRRYYQHHEVLLVRTIRELLYEQGYTIQGARQQLALKGGAPSDDAFELLHDNENEVELEDAVGDEAAVDDLLGVDAADSPLLTAPIQASFDGRAAGLIEELRAIRELLNRG